MSDWTDAASEIEQRERDAALARHLARSAASMRGRQDVTDCEDCGEPIEVARRQALPGATRCAACAREAERVRGDAACVT